uniref:Uncharacterized protein n=1 Tax=Meloidogyne incognita TaxID=6306 RepID=A0A914MCS3_MELIC
MTEEMIENENDEDISHKLDILPSQRHHLSATLLGENEERRQKTERAFSLGIFESSQDDHLYWISLLPNKDTQKNRLRLIKSIFSEKWQNANNSRFRPFSILKAYATKFWTKESFNGRTGQIIRRPPPHNEWLPLISDYALALNLAQNKTQIRKKMFGLRMFSNNPFPTPPADWLLSAVFLSSGLCSDFTIDLLERLILNRDKISLECFWPHSIRSSDNNSFEDYLTTKIYPLILSFLQKYQQFQPLIPFLSSIKLPSLLHLFLFYSQQIYLNILPFKLVEEYLLLAIIGGPEAQVIFNWRVGNYK